MLHCLAYGNSDQASFRDLEVRECFDILTVPSTIASYYADATAAFVLSSGLKYMIEPRTPLFQDVLRQPRASHYTLASVMGDTVSAYVDENREKGDRINFPVDFYSDDVCAEVVTSIVNFQREYGGRAKDVSTKLNRYRELLKKATGGSKSVGLSDETRGPTYVLCPYFAVQSFSDAWWNVMGKIWNAAQQIDNPAEILPVVAMSSASALQRAIESVPDSLSSRVFFWIPGFDEKIASLDKLYEVKEAVSSLATAYGLMNLYGGYFSILLGKFGLDGFNNGLGYSESREWPTLDSTGAAPARYYVRRLHAYVSQATATAIVETDNAFACGCSVCEGKRLPEDLSYHELKKHFALARAWEIEQSERIGLGDLCSILRDTAERCKRLKLNLPSNLRVPTGHLSRWADALES